MVTDGMLMAASFGVSQEIKEQNESKLTQTNQNLIVAFLTQALALKENGHDCYDRYDIECLLMDNASDMVEFALDAIYK